MKSYKLISMLGLTAFAVVACAPTANSGSAIEPINSTDSSLVSPSTATTSPVAPEPSASTAEQELGTLPDLVGKGLQVAQDRAQEAGFFRLSSHDALGRGRQQILDRDWQVCAQSPSAGQVSTTETVDFAAVKIGEECPVTDAGRQAPESAGATMPNFKGKSAEVARQSLGSNASITFKDGLGLDRNVFIPSNWKICKQQPKAGEPFDGVPVTLTVVKFEEDC